MSHPLVIVRMVELRAWSEDAQAIVTLAAHRCDRCARLHKRIYDVVFQGRPMRVGQGCLQRLIEQIPPMVERTTMPPPQAPIQANCRIVPGLGVRPLGNAGALPPPQSSPRAIPNQTPSDRALHVPDTWEADD